MANTNPILQLKVNLDGAKPPIWRRVLVHEDTDFLTFHYVIQSLMGWMDSHLYEFEINMQRISGGNTMFAMFDEENEDVLDASKVYLKDFIYSEKQKFRYTYDFGDCWEHIILVEKFLPIEKDKNYPICIKGKMNCPPEDCGGIWGFYDMLAIIKDKKHPEREEMLEWLDEDYDEKYFDIEEINDDLQSI